MGKAQRAVLGDSSLRLGGSRRRTLALKGKRHIVLHMVSEELQFVCFKYQIIVGAN